MDSSRDSRIEEEDFWNDDEGIKGNLRRLLGDEGYQLVLEAYGGLRLFIPTNLKTAGWPTPSLSSMQPSWRMRFQVSIFAFHSTGASS